jgi:hypothetical protein
MKYRDELAQIYDSPEFFEEDKLDLDEALGLKSVDEKLIQSDSEKAFKKNVETEIKAGKDPKQAVAIAHSVKEKNEDLEYDYDDAKGWEGTFDVATEQETANAFQQPVKGKDKTYLPKLSIEEVRELALEHYNEGGDVVVECWTDEDIMLWLEEHPTKEELLDLFSKYYDHYQDMRGYGDYAILDKEDSEDSTDDEQELYQDYYDEEDFGPSNPWDAPGMSIKDFLR